jgi:hypothetical protein
VPLPGPRLALDTLENVITGCIRVAYGAQARRVSCVRHRAHIDHQTIEHWQRQSISTLSASVPIATPAICADGGPTGANLPATFNWYTPPGLPSR